ncbi:hypothetical protein T4A_4373 [Trichinella pseudospiralis]|uniref:Uncharacterized protein n=1 Tax=Trichinella pseudospiralis TaxID=6337 RepID=A0A0V1E679_TRIPS|nr:hypothetical protein T4A_4373 [Trichinella pseudospiralis]
MSKKEETKAERRNTKLEKVNAIRTFFTFLHTEVHLTCISVRASYNSDIIRIRTLRTDFEEESMELRAVKFYHYQWSKMKANVLAHHEFNPVKQVISVKHHLMGHQHPDEKILVLICPTYVWWVGRDARKVSKLSSAAQNASRQCSALHQHILNLLNEKCTHAALYLHMTAAHVCLACELRARRITLCLKELFAHHLNT